LKATVVDIIISVILPGWGLIVGALAFFAKGEKKRGATMMIIGAFITSVASPSATSSPPDYRRAAKISGLTPARSRTKGQRTLDSCFHPVGSFYA